MIPSIGRLVHYIIPSGLNQGQRRAALIVDIADEKPTEKSPVTLLVFNSPSDARGYVSFQPDLYQDPTAKSVGTWHAPQQQAQPTVDQDAADLALLERLEAAAQRRDKARRPAPRQVQGATEQASVSPESAAKPSTPPAATDEKKGA